MGTVIGLSTFLARQRRPFASAAPRAAQGGFTPRDRVDLDRWERAPGRSKSICTGDLGTFAMLYEEGRSWASWGVVRQGRLVLLWNCVTLADVGRFPSMVDALAEVADQDERPETVIRFSATRPAPVSLRAP